MKLYTILENTESNQICLTQQQIEFIHSKYGVNLTNTMNEEKDKKYKFNDVCFSIEYSQMKNIVADVKNHMKHFDKKIGSILNWYKTTHDFIHRELGEDATLFLMLLGVTSSMTAVIRNMLATIKLFDDIDYDIKHNKDLLIEFVKSKEKFKHHKNLDPKFHNLQLFNFLKEGLLYGGGFMNNIIKILNLYIDNGFKLDKKTAVMWMQGHFNKKEKTIAGESIKGYKVHNFVMNLIDPDFEVINRKNILYYVTIDRHMIRYLIPDSREGLELVTARIFSNDRGLYYILANYIDKIRIELEAQKLPLSNIQLQALIWYIAIKKYGRDSVTFKSYVDVLDQIEQLLITHDETIKKTSLTLKEMIIKLRGKHKTYNKSKYYTDPNQTTLF